jgi:hypothetical protein
MACDVCVEQALPVACCQLYADCRFPMPDKKVEIRIAAYRKKG